MKKHQPSGTLQYSPSDLMRFVASPFASWMTRYRIENPDRGIQRDPDSEENAILQQQGLDHEAAFLAQLQSEGKSVYTVEDGDPDAMFHDTVAAMKAGHDVIFQAYLRSGSFAGYADFLYRKSGSSAWGEHHYEPWDTKLAQSVKPYFIVQLCCYAEMLADIQARRPDHMGVILGDGSPVQHRVSDFFYSYRAIKADFVAQMAGDFGPDAAAPIPLAGADHKPVDTHAKAILLDRDHLSQVAGMTRRQTDRLEAAGIATMAALAQTTLTKVAGLRAELFERLKEQAKLQIESRGLERPTYRVVPTAEAGDGHGLSRLPPPSPMDVFFDIEGYPLVKGGLEYLFGATTRTGDALAFRAFWAHNKTQEKTAFEAFIDWVMERWKADPSMHVYHYAPYEVTAMRTLMGAHATREDEVDALLREGVFVDLYQVVREGLRVGEPSYSIKNLEHLYWEARDGDVQSGGASIVQYYNWIQSGESEDIAESPLLKAIHDYNQDDCDSTAALYDWLRLEAAKHGIQPLGGPAAEPEEERVLPDDVVARRDLREQILQVYTTDHPDHRLGVLLAELLEFYRREDKPMWWRHFDRLQKTLDELADDADCLAAMARTQDPIEDLGRGSRGVWYRYPVHQETKMGPGSKGVPHAHADIGGAVSIERIEPGQGRVKVKFTKKALVDIGGDGVPAEMSLIPKESSLNHKLEQSVVDQIQAWFPDGTLPSAIDQFLRRAPVRLTGGTTRSRQGSETASDQAIRLVTELDGGTLCIQGPPGAGKTYTGARMILAAIRAGKRVGISSNSHKAIQNLMLACVSAAAEQDVPLRAVKVDSSAKKPFFREQSAVEYSASSGIVAHLDEGVQLVGATAWGFARPEVAGAFDLLVVDESGQVSLANLLAMSRAAANLVLLGDQRQLGQPIQGSHPGETGRSALEYLLEEHAIIPPSLGVFLDQTWRLRPEICGFISDAFYDGQLSAVPTTSERALQVPDHHRSRLPAASGVVYTPVVHHGNSVGSTEEAEAIAALVSALLDCRFTEDGGATDRPMTLSDIVIVAPYNVQVRLLTAALPEGARIGTVDKFQGQEAPVVLVSMACSTLDESSRGAQFLFEPNRLNVAISRAQVLAMVVASPALANPAAGSVEQLQLSNLFCRVVAEGTASPD